MVQSNCLSLETVETQFGPKTVIDQASCNIDESCVRGDCPSFMEVIPGVAKKAEKMPAPTALPAPIVIVNSDHCSLRIVGVGGTGVVTLNQIIGTAAMLDGRHVSGLDQTGLAQKGGPVISDLIVSTSEFPKGTRMGSGSADVLLVCDPMAGASARTLDVTQSGHTIACMTTAASPAGRMLIDRSITMPTIAEMRFSIGEATARDSLIDLDAEAVAVAHGLTAAVANVVLLGFAFQSGLIPLSASSIEQAIAVNGAAVPANLAAFAWGRAMAHDPSLRPMPATSAMPADLGQELADYQSARYAEKWRIVAEAATDVDPEFGDAVAKNLFKLMAYKDEYEVARLALHPTSKQRIVNEFGEGAKVAYRLHPPALRALGMSSKLRLRHSAPVAFGVLRAARRLRGTPFDAFGYAKVRRVERNLVEEYSTLVVQLGRQFESFDERQRDIAVRIASLPEMIRGYEHVKLKNVERYRAELAARKAELAESGARRPELV